MRPAQESAARIVRAGAACILRAGDLAAPPGAAAAEAARRPTVVWSRTCLLAADGDVKVHLGCNLRALLLLGGVSRVAYRREERQPEHQCRRSAHFVSSVRGVDVAATNFGTNCPSQPEVLQEGKGLRSGVTGTMPIGGAKRRAIPEREKVPEVRSPRALAPPLTLSSRCAPLRSRRRRAARSWRPSWQGARKSSCRCGIHTSPGMHSATNLVCALHNLQPILARLCPLGMPESESQNERARESERQSESKIGERKERQTREKRREKGELESENERERRERERERERERKKERDAQTGRGRQTDRQTDRARNRQTAKV